MNEGYKARPLPHPTSARKGRLRGKKDQQREKRRNRSNYQEGKEKDLRSRRRETGVENSEGGGRLIGEFGRGGK